MMRTRSRVLLGLLILAVALAWARTALTAGTGLRAEYAAESLAGPQVHYAVDRQISTAAIAAAWNGAPPPRFVAHWSGYVVVNRTGHYTFATTSDDGSSLAIDGLPVVDNRGDHPARTRTGSVLLHAGPHAILIDYEQAGGGYDMALAWGRNDGPLAAVPGWALWTHRASAGRALATRVIRPMPVLALIAFVLAAVWVVAQDYGEALLAAATRTRGARVTLRVVLTAASLGLAVGSAEWTARVIFRHVQSSGDMRTYFAARGAPRMRVNNVGFRDPDIAADSHGRYRIVIVGDSITWGQGLEEDQRFSNIVQSALGPGYEVVNFGTPSHNLPEHLRTLKQALTLKPDFVLLQLYTNDFELEEMERPVAHRLLPSRSLDAWLLHSSALYTLLAAQWPQVQVRIGLSERYEDYMFRYLGDPQAPMARRAFGMLRDFIAGAGAAGVPSGTVMFPNPAFLGKSYALAYLHDRVQETCTQLGIACVDLREPFLSKFSQLSEIVVSPFDGHPSASANRVAADAILRTFRAAWQAGAPPTSVTSRRTPSGASRNGAPAHAAAR